MLAAVIATHVTAAPLIVAGPVTIYTRLVEGRFPNYRQVMPGNPDERASFVSAPLLAAVKQAAVMTDADSRRIAFSFAKNRLTLQGKGVSAGKSHVELPVEYADKAVSINFDPKFLVDMLKIMPPDARLSLGMNGSGKPAMLRNEAGDYRYVVVPMVVKGEDEQAEKEEEEKASKKGKKGEPQAETAATA